MCIHKKLTPITGRKDQKMLLTVDEARKLKPLLAELKSLKKEFRTYKNTVNAFGIWFFVLTTIRALVVSTVIASLIKQEPNLLIAWEKGEGAMIFLLYLVISCLPIIGNLVNVFAPIAVIIAAFTMGGGIANNFVPFVLPIAIAYAATFGLIFYSNYLFNSLLKHSCPKIYKRIEIMSELDDTAARMFFYDSDISRDDMISRYNDSSRTPETTKTTQELEPAAEREIDSDEYYDDTF